MGIDKQLSDRYPSVIINRVRYHYGKSPESGNYLVENAFIAKDYWWFSTEADLVAFLVNLPDSAEKHRYSSAYPDWSEATPEQRDIYRAEYQAKLRALAEEKIRAGTAQEFIMDLEGQKGPHIPQPTPGSGLSVDEPHWVVGLWTGVMPPYYGQRAVFHKEVAVPLGGEAKVPEPGARPQYVMAEIVAPAWNMAVVVGATKDREYAYKRTEQYERGAVPIQDPFMQSEEKQELRKKLGPTLEL